MTGSGTQDASPMGEGHRYPTARRSSRLLTSGGVGSR